ncbi:MAG TPA: CHAT domain-containing tetratricopeptide repeat protein [Steroidobacteraceae bacterium]|nr:CHAT domain-containing tetratricopeptide repeat protein [Steroidobacteraceae bacterium]
MNKNKKLVLPVLAIALLTHCTSRPSTPDGATLLDEQVALEREAKVDVARREIAVDGDSIVVALVDEQLTDVKVNLTVIDSDDAPAPVEVENNLRGSGTEIAATEAPRGSRVAITLTGPKDSTAPGRVQLRVRRFDAHPEDARYTTQVAAFRAWSSATNSSLRTDAIKATALGDMDRAIAGLSGPQGVPALAAMARMVKSNMLLFFQVDWREARAEAQRAASAFGALPRPDTLNESRSRLIESLALLKIAADRKATNPTSDEAVALVRGILARLVDPLSMFGPIERARAITAIGLVEFSITKLDEADQRFAEAQAIYNAAGYSAGEREIRCNLANVLLERGRFRDAAQAFVALLPEADEIANPSLRVSVLLGAARGQSFSGRTDSAAELQIRGLAVAREYQLRDQEASALHGLGHVYANRGDMLQAGAFFAEVLRITRDGADVMGYVWALASAGVIAREDGNIARALELHKEAVSLASNPIGQVRTLRELGLDYLFARDYPAAIAEFRRSLAVDLHDPTHHAYSDVKRNLAQTLIEIENPTPDTYREAARLLDETLQSSLRVGDKMGEIGAHRFKAQLLANQGKTREALAEFERTFALADVYRANSSSPEAHRATLNHVQSAFRGYLDLEMKSVVARGPGKVQPASEREVAALRRLEMARDANFGAARTGELDVETAGKVDALMSQMAIKSLAIGAMLKRELSSTEQSELASLQSGMADLHAELDRLRTAAAAKTAVAENSRAIAARDWRPLVLGGVQLSYVLGNHHAYVWSRSDDGIFVSVLAKAPHEIEQELIALGALDRQLAPEKVERALEQVAAVLLPAGLLPENSTAVDIVAEGRIAGVPFPGLRSATQTHRRLAETHAITMITSMFAVDEQPRLKQARPFRLVALASGNGTLRSAAVVDAAPKLQAATKEIRTVADLFVARDSSAKVKLLLGAEGSATTLHSIWATGADVVHFATHALADLRQPLASLLVLPATDASGAATYLTAGQVEGWRGDAELVFLSACESAIGPPRFASGMPGLQRAFLRAGARGVIATLWPIEDVLAQEFSADFYRRYTDGKSAAQSLSETQRAWLMPRKGADAAEQTRRRITALAHGFYAP